MPTVVLLDKGIHNRKAFTSGSEPLDRYIRERAASDVANKVGVYYVLVADDDPAVILGYYTLSNLSISLTDVPENARKHLPRYPSVPTTLLGRLAVDERCRRQRFGEFLLLDALYRALESSESIDSALVVVDPKDRGAARFYARYGFEALASDTLRLYLPMGTIATLQAQAGH